MHMTALDLTLAGLLLVILPAWQLWRSRPGAVLPDRPKLHGYARTGGIILALLAILAIAWAAETRDIGALGLDIPISQAGLIALGASVLAIAGLFALVALSPTKRDSNPPTMDLLPQTPAEYAAFPVVTVLIGCGWEILYRGFLLWALTPAIGQTAAIIAAAFAYGLSHGYKSPVQLGGSIVMALAFTIAYALSGSLWWLMFIHTAIPFVALVAQRRIARAGQPTS